MLDVPSDDLTSGTYRANDLRSAVGIDPLPDPAEKKDKKAIKAEKAAAKAREKEDRKRAKAKGRGGGDDGGDGDLDDDDAPSGRGRAILIWALVSFFTLGTGALIFFGYMNSGHYYLTCEPEQVMAERGRGFPPWGTRAMGGDEWKPIKIPPEAECNARETDNELELSAMYLEILKQRANVMLTAREVTKVDDAAGMLEQALLHARSPERRDERKDIERLLGDVGYWRASAKLRDASNALLDAAKQFETAAAQRPHHVNDASAWATYVRKLVDDLKAGPSGVKSSTFPPMPPDEKRPPAPPGTALPVEPHRGTDEPPPSTAPDAPPTPAGGVMI